jgi:hypothetical protein
LVSFVTLVRIAKVADRLVAMEKGLGALTTILSVRIFVFGGPLVEQTDGQVDVEPEADHQGGGAFEELS